MTLSIDVLTDPARIGELIPAWDALALRDPRSTPYDCGSLLTGLGDIVDTPRRPYIITARTSDGALAGVLPLCCIPLVGRLGGRRLMGYARWHTSYFDACTEPSVEGVASALLAALPPRRDWEQCDLQFMRPEGNLLQAAFIHTRRAAGASQFISRAHAAGSMSQTVMGHKAARRLERKGDLEFTGAVPTEELESTLRWFAAQHTERWRDQGQSAEFAEPGAVRRLITVMARAVDGGSGRVGALRVSGQLVAVHLAFRWRDVQYSWRMAHDSQWQAMSPGRLLMSLMIEEAFTTGCRSYDLGRGDERYKQLWPTSDRPLYRLTFSGSSWRARLATLRART